MSSDTTYTTEEYLGYVKMDSGSRHLLVEGRDDQNAFAALFGQILIETDRDLIAIDTAATLIEAEPENREIVEDICCRIVNHDYADRFAGFVDREFRGFDCGSELRDMIRRHEVCDRLVWSRGHSIENYFFDLMILSDPLRTVCPIGFDDVVADFGATFQSAICVACAIGLAANEAKMLRRVRSTIDASIVAIEEQQVKLDLDSWRSSLQRVRMSAEDIQRLFTRYSHWHTKTQDSDVDVVRWLCDGHIGFRLVWATYESYLLSAGHQLAPAPVLALRINMCALVWGRIAMNGTGTYPVEVLELLGLRSSTQVL